MEPMLQHFLVLIRQNISKNVKIGYGHNIVNKMLVKKYIFDDNVHIKENVRIDALKNEGKNKMLGQREKKKTINSESVANLNATTLV